METTIVSEQNKARFDHPILNKSFVTNITTVLIIIVGYLTPFYQDHILSVGYFSLSGAITNWLAIHMLFERVPGLYGSGVIPLHFKEFKKGIHHLIMNQFFTKENTDRFFNSIQGNSNANVKLDRLIDLINYDLLYGKFEVAIMESPFGSMLGMFGGKEALTPLKEPFIVKMKEAIKDMSKDESFNKNLKNIFSESINSDSIIDQVEKIVQMRLDDLTPRMVKEIVQEMIRKHLGWLVVWGGVFGGCIGLITSLLRI